jgi:hypothetical protein
MRYCLLATLLITLTACVTPATVPTNLKRERFEIKPWRANTYLTERGTVSYTLANVVSNIDVMLLDKAYHIKGLFEAKTYAMEFDCRSKVAAKERVFDTLQGASYACYDLDEPPERAFVLAFDQQCRSGVLKTPHNSYTLKHWVHDKYGWQEGFKVYNTNNTLVGAISWSFGGEDFNGVHVDPSLPEYDRDLLTITRTAILAAREGEELGPVCGTMDSIMDRTSPPPEG